MNAIPSLRRYGVNSHKAWSLGFVGSRDNVDAGVTIGDRA